MEITLAEIADAANISQDGKLNLCGVFSTIYAAHVPAVHPALTLVVRLRADPAERGRRFRFGLVLMGQDREIMRFPELDGQIASQGPDLFHNVIYTLVAIPLPEFGRYSFRILVDNDAKGAVDFNVTSVNQAGQDSVPQK